MKVAATIKTPSPVSGMWAAAVGARAATLVLSMLIWLCIGLSPPRLAVPRSCGIGLSGWVLHCREGGWLCMNSGGAESFLAFHSLNTSSASLRRQSFACSCIVSIAGHDN